MIFKVKVITLYFLLNFVIIIPTYSQIYISSNPADIFEVKSSFINPAIISFQDSQFILGSKIIQYGFLDNDEFGVKNNFASFSLRPFSKLDFFTGVQITSLSFPIYTENIIDLVTSYQISSRISIGTQLGILNKGFNKDKFNLVDENDPVFEKGTSKTVLNFSAGIFTFLTKNLQFGMGLLHLNQPNISFIGDNIKQPLIINGSGNLLFNSLSFSAGFRMIDNDINPKVSTSFFRKGLGFIRLGYNSYSSEFQLQLNTIKNLSFDYKFSLPSGPNKEYIEPSHQLSLIWRKSDRIEFIVRSSVNHLLRTDIDSICHLDKSINVFERKNLIPSSYIIINEDSIKSSSLTIYMSYIQYYRQILDLASKACLNDRSSLFRIIAAEDKKEIAIALYKYVKDSLNVPITQLEIGIQSQDKSASKSNIKIPIPPTHNIRFSPNFTVFYLGPSPKDRYKRWKPIKYWQLNVEDEEGNIIFLREDTKDLPVTVKWNWYNNLGQYIKAGVYTFYMRWQDYRGREYETKKGKIWVENRIINYQVDVSTYLKQPKQDRKVIELFIGS